jgi:hypothetical protein
MDEHHNRDIIQSLEESFPELYEVPDTPPENIAVSSRTITRQTPPENEPRWYRPIEESRYWSKNVIVFYHNGDAPFCYSGFLGSKKLGSDFWGTLLGYQGNGYLSTLV